VEVLVLTFTARSLAAGLLLIPATLLARWASVGPPVALLRRWQPIGRSMAVLLTWGGLRGGISVALALSFRERAAGVGDWERELILAVTYVVVVFSVLVQGMTVGPLVRRLFKSPEIGGPTTPHIPSEAPSRENPIHP
jgi:CPA1 family monovalent cation:H+ antiporter